MRDEPIEGLALTSSLVTFLPVLARWSRSQVLISALTFSHRSSRDASAEVGLAGESVGAGPVGEPEVMKVAGAGIAISLKESAISM